MKLSNMIVVVCIVAISLAASTSFALSPFKKAFDGKYVKSSGSTDFQADFKKASCNTCHVKGKKKDVLNDYGLRLAEAIEGLAKDRLDAAKKKSDEAKKAEEEKLLKEFAAALKKVEEVKAPSGKTYGEMFKAHSLPTADGAKSIRK